MGVRIKYTRERAVNHYTVGINVKKVHCYFERHSEQHFLTLTVLTLERTQFLFVGFGICHLMMFNSTTAPVP